MTFPAKHLNDGEEIVIDIHPHWWYLAGPVAVVAILLAGALTMVVVGTPRWARLAAVVVVAAAVLWLLGRYLRWRTTSFVCTSLRLIDRHGILGKTGREIPLDHLSDISYHQTFFDRLIGAGDLLLESAGRDSQQVFPDLPHPARLQNEIYRQIELAKAPQATSSPTYRESSIPEQIEKLAELRQRGVLTQAEFDVKKSELLNRL
jgi:uncharacterized membrane protein YdbT with pleckstrin-like domain